ncbi:MAG: carbamoyltransferase [Betaproteobacteria bacterium]|jgi:carbamoyltransferase|nr:carbamoyltransferase [Betaproteobacteria bacterium]
MRILGISAYYHDSAAALLRDGQVIAASQEERFTRKKHDAAFPHNAVRACLEATGTRLSEVDFVAFYDKPFLKFERLLETYLAFAPRGFSSFRTALPVWVKDKLFQKNTILKELKALDDGIDWDKKLLFSEHHLSHAASAYYPSPFEHAAVLTMDGVGEWTTTSLALGKGRDLKVAKEIHFPHSLGLLYSAFTYYTGFKVNSGEYKVMGLAPYGNPVFKDKILENLIDLKDDGSFRLNLEYFDYCTGLTMTNDKFAKLFGAPPRKSEDKLTQREMDLAASIQAVTEEVVLKLAAGIVKETGEKNLCLAGGVALNCVANGKLARSGIVERLWMQPAAGDAGGALGAALVAHHLFKQQPRTVGKGLDAMRGGYLGPQFGTEEIERRLRRAGAVFETLDDQALIGACAGALADGSALGWFQGRMEFGPRALGARSILGDARSPSMQKQLNLKVKYRESFRPFAPAVLAEDAEQYFDIKGESPYMLLVADVAESERIGMNEEQKALFGIDRLNVPRSSIPAVTHVDYSARVQTVHRETNAKFHDLISSFKEKTGCPVVVNTSFNVRGEPIVGTPEDAFRCFMGTEIERLAVGNCFLKKENQDPKLKISYENQFELD